MAFNGGRERGEKGENGLRCDRWFHLADIVVLLAWCLSRTLGDMKPNGNTQHYSNTSSKQSVQDRRFSNSREVKEASDH